MSARTGERLKAPTEINWAALSDDEARDLWEIAIPIYRGYSHAEVAVACGRSKAWVGNRLKRLREEIVATAPPEH